MKATRVYVAAVCVVLMSLATGFLAGWFLSRGTKKDSNKIQHNEHRMAEYFSDPIEDWAKDIDPKITERLMGEISASKIEQNLR